jgi:hypothetical protein
MPGLMAFRFLSISAVVSQPVRLAGGVTPQVFIRVFNPNALVKQG